MSPKTCGAFVDYSRRLLLQSSIDVEAMVRDDLARVIALELDRVGYSTALVLPTSLWASSTPLASALSPLTSFGTFAEYIGMETDVAVCKR